MIASPVRTVQGPKTVPIPPPLENGDRLVAAEFLRRYEAMPDLKKAELIDGRVHTTWSVPARQHGIPCALLQGWLGTYSAYTPGIFAAARATVRLDGDNVAQPDALLMRIESEQARIGKDDFVHGAPELIGEVAGSGASLDLHGKLHAYRRAGVCEYVVWRPSEEALDWFILEEDQFIPNPPDARGVVKSRSFPGLVLDVSALLRQDGKKVLGRLSRSLGKGAHKAFVATLKRK